MFSSRVDLPTPVLPIRWTCWRASTTSRPTECPPIWERPSTFTPRPPDGIAAGAGIAFGPGPVQAGHGEVLWQRGEDGQLLDGGQEPAQQPPRRQHRHRVGHPHPAQPVGPGVGGRRRGEGVRQARPAAPASARAAPPRTVAAAGYAGHPCGSWQGDPARHPARRRWRRRSGWRSRSAAPAPPCPPPRAGGRRPPGRAPPSGRRRCAARLAGGWGRAGTRRAATGPARSPAGPWLLTALLDMSVPPAPPDFDAARRARRTRRGWAGRARICTHACSRCRTPAPAASNARSGSASCSVRSGSPSASCGHNAPPACSATAAGIGAPAASSVATVQAGHAARTALSTAPGGTVPGTHTRIVRVRPVQVYSHATCGMPKIRRRHTAGVSTPVIVVHSAAADSGVTSGGAAIDHPPGTGSEAAVPPGEHLVPSEHIGDQAEYGDDGQPRPRDRPVRP